jgi:hypothetical protein
MSNSPIDGDIDVVNEYHLARSVRRRATTHEIFRINEEVVV